MAVDSLGWQSEVGAPPETHQESRSDGSRLCSCLTASIEELRRASQRSSLRDYPWGGGRRRPGIGIPGYRRSLLRNWRFSCEPPIVARLSSAESRSNPGLAPNATSFVAERREPSGFAVRTFTHRAACAAPLTLQSQAMVKVDGIGLAPGGGWGEPWSGALRPVACSKGSLVLDRLTIRFTWRGASGEDAEHRSECREVGADRRDVAHRRQ